MNLRNFDSCNYVPKWKYCFVSYCCNAMEFVAQGRGASSISDITWPIVCISIIRIFSRTTLNICFATCQNNKKKQYDINQLQIESQLQKCFLFCTFHSECWPWYPWMYLTEKIKIYCTCKITGTVAATAAVAKTLKIRPSTCGSFLSSKTTCKFSYLQTKNN